MKILKTDEDFKLAQTFEINLIVHQDYEEIGIGKIIYFDENIVRLSCGTYYFRKSCDFLKNDELINYH
jgi:hypothetical protein